MAERDFGAELFVVDFIVRYFQSRKKRRARSLFDDVCH